MRGKRYNRHFSLWLDTYPKFKILNSATRTHLYAILDNLHAIQYWRAHLSEQDRFRWNHPDTVLRKWREHTGAIAPKKKKGKTLRESVIDLNEENARLRTEVASLKSDADFISTTIKDDADDIAYEIDKHWPLGSVQKARDIADCWLRLVRSRERDLNY